MTVRDCTRASHELRNGTLVLLDLLANVEASIDLIESGICYARKFVDSVAHILLRGNLRELLVEMLFRDFH
jgi:hypothetical protein